MRLQVRGPKLRRTVVQCGSGRRGNSVDYLHVLPLTRDLRPAGEPARVGDQRYANMPGLAWTANGREIVYSAGGLRASSLWRVRVSGRQMPRRLPFALPAAMFPAITSTPPCLVYTWGVYNVNLQNS